MVMAQLIRQTGVWDTLRAVLERHGILQTELADQMGKTQSTIADYLRPGRRIGFDLLTEVAEALNAILSDRGFPQRYTAASLQEGPEPAKRRGRGDRRLRRAPRRAGRPPPAGRPRETVTIPYYGPAPCGTPLLLEDEPEPEALELADLIDDPLQPGRHLLLRPTATA